jgi:hypothetical protein
MTEGLLTFFALCAGFVVVLWFLHWSAGRWLRKRREQDEPWLAQTELWDKLDRLVSEAEADGCRLSVEDGRIKFQGNELTMRAQAILTVLEKHHDDTLVVLANRRHEIQLGPRRAS